MWNLFSSYNANKVTLTDDPKSQNLEEQIISTNIIQSMQRNSQMDQTTKEKRQSFQIDEFHRFHLHIKGFEKLINQKTYQESEKQRISDLFSGLLEQLQSFIRMASQVSSEYEENKDKMDRFSILQRQLSQREATIKELRNKNQEIEKSKNHEINKTRSELDSLEESMRQQAQAKDSIIDELKQTIKQIQGQNQSKDALLEELKQQNKQTHKQSGRGVLQSLSSTSVREKQIFETPLLVDPDNITFEIVFSNSKHRETILNFLSISDFPVLFRVSKRLSLLSRKSFPAQIYQKVVCVERKSLQSLELKYKHLEDFILKSGDIQCRNEDTADDENVKINAIKYLFFKQKPGSYIVPMFQEDISGLSESEPQFSLQSSQQPISQPSGLSNHKGVDQKRDQPTGSTQNSQELQKNSSAAQQKQGGRLSSLKNIFRSKEESEVKDSDLQSEKKLSKTKDFSGKKFSLTDLKSTEQFQYISNQINKTFHHHFFSLSLPKDLKSFGTFMQDQFLELKSEISSVQRTKGIKNDKNQLTIQQFTSKLVVLAKFLYLQSQELSVLCQNIFKKLIVLEQCHQHSKYLLEDMTEKQCGVRMLVAELSKNKLETDKKIWNQQRQILSLKQQIQSLELKNMSEQRQKKYQKEQSEALRMQCEKQSNLGKAYKKRLEELTVKYKNKLQEFRAIKQRIMSLTLENQNQ